MSDDTRDRKTQAAEGSTTGDNESVLTVEIVTKPLPNPPGISYTDDQLRVMQLHHSRLKPIEPGDLCCHCGKDCDGEGFSIGTFRAYRINGHPLCGRTSCYDAHREEFVYRRQECRCGRRKR